MPNANRLITFEISGPGEIVATDNSDPTDMNAFPSRVRESFNRLALAIVKARPGETGKITVTARSDGLTVAETSISSRK